MNARSRTGLPRLLALFLLANLRSAIQFQFLLHFHSEFSEPDLIYLILNASS